MKIHLAGLLVVSSFVAASKAADPPPGNTEHPTRALPAIAEGWSIDLALAAPQIVFPTAIVAAPDGTVYLGSDPMDMPGPPTEPIDRVLAVKNGKVAVFADKLWSVMGLEWRDETLYVVHAPFLSAFRDTDGDGRADARVDLVTGLGPKLPGFNGINDHIASGVRLGMDGFLYISVGDKGIPRAVGRDGRTIALFGGGVIRVRPDGTDLEIVSTGECNPLSVALSAADEIFTFGNDDDSKKWPNSLTHHIAGGHFGYPYQFLTAPHRALPIMAGDFGGSGAQGICYNDDGLPPEYSGNLFFCDWGRQTVYRFEIKKSGGTHALVKRTELVSRGKVADFRPFSLAVAADGDGLWLVDWAFNGWLAAGPQTGRLYRLRYTGTGVAARVPRPTGDDLRVRSQALDHPALAVRLESQQILQKNGSAAVPLLVERLKSPSAETGRLHALWALDAIGGDSARQAIGEVLADPSGRVRLQATRSAGIRGDQAVLKGLIGLLKDRDPAVRREAAIALGRLGDRSAAAALYAALGDSDAFAAWSVRRAIRRLGAWDKPALVEALLDERRLEPALRLTDEAWALPVVEALNEALSKTGAAPVRARIIANLTGLYRRYPQWSGLWFGTNPLAGEFPRRTEEWSPDGMKQVQNGLALGLADRSTSVRFQAIVGFAEVGPAAAPQLRAALIKESDATNQAVIVESLATLSEPKAVPLLSAIVADDARAEQVRLAAINALARSRDPQSLRARLALLYDPKASAALIARALPDMARSGILPLNDLASFLEHPAPSVRAAAILSLNVKAALPDYVQQSVIDRLMDQNAEVREAAMLAAVPLRLRAAIPRLMAVAADPASTDRTAALEALCGMPDPRALSAYVAAIEDRNPRLRRSGELALLALRDGVADELRSIAASGNLTASAAMTIERVLARFVPIRDWRVIGPFPRTAPLVFVGQPAIDFAQKFKDAAGRSISWNRRRADIASGRLVLDDLQQGAGENGRFGYDTSGSPDLCAFAYSEVETDRAGPGLLLLGSSGTLIVTVNEKIVYQYTNSAGRGFLPDTDTAHVELARGKNRIVVVSRQGIGTWAFSLQLARVEPRTRAKGPTAPAAVAELTRYALEHAGDPRRGEAIFFDSKGMGCARCHTIAGRGTAAIGPDLTGLATKYDRAEVIRSVLDPSNRIATGYQPVIVATRDGKVETGVVRAESEMTLELADSEARITRVPRSDIELRRVGNISTMPAGLVEKLSPRDFADLISFLMSLKQSGR